ncbi:unnamed protein product, partial [Lampetra planeri]
MASKRKSTTPCMIPSKLMHVSEDTEPDSPAVVRQSRIAGEGRNSPMDPEAADTVKEGCGIYTCRPCNFETHDLNLFLDHVYTGHPDFRSEPSFLCVSCGFSAPKFEGLALHNARVHPSTLNTTLHLRKRDKGVVVEQSLVTVAGKDHEISITKTPIMRRLKGKSEPKRIVVSHSVSDESSSDTPTASASRETERNEAAAATVTQVSTIVHNGTAKVTLPSAIQIVNGSGTLPLLKTPITQVMIPLSSIPTYSASMDSSSFLKTSFSKFPYPTKAELCYLTVVTKFPEEQIKIWFTAQRLKQGISWSPEEIEEARRKMFNTIIQTAPSSSQTQSPAQHTITVLPASLGATGIPHILQGSLVSQAGVIVTQPVMANGIQVSSAPVALAVTPKPQAAARPTMQARPAAALSSSPSPAAASSSTLLSRGVNSFLDPSFCKGKKSQGQLSALKDSFLANQFPDQEEVDRLITLTGLTVREVRKWFSDRRYHFRNLKGPRSGTGGQTKSAAGAGSANPMDLSDSSSSGDKTPQHSSAPLSPTTTQTPTSPSTPSRRILRAASPDFTAIRYKEREPHQVKALEASFAQDPEPSGEEVDRLRLETKMTRREIHGWFTEKKKRVAAEKKREEAERALREEEEQVELDGEEKPKEDGSGELKVNPIKINLKMLKVTETSGKAEGEGLECPPCSPPPQLTNPPSPPKPTAVRGKKTAEQLHLLKQAYARTQWPSASQYDELISATGLPRPEVVRWFGDCRYMQKNSQLKWLESYQNMTLEEDLQRGDANVLQAHLNVHGSQQESQLQELAEASGLTADLVRHWFSTK